MEHKSGLNIQPARSNDQKTNFIRNVMQELHARLKQNPLIKEALEAHEKEKHTLDPTKSRQSVAGVLSRMAKKKPPTRTEIQVTYYLHAHNSRTFGCCIDSCLDLFTANL